MVRARKGERKSELFELKAKGEEGEEEDEARIWDFCCGQSSNQST